MKLLYPLLMVLCMVVALAAIAPGAAAQGPSETAREARIKADLRDVLSSPDFRYAPPQPSVWEKVWKWLSDRWAPIRDWLRRVFGGLGGVRAPGSAVAIAPYILFGVLGAGLLVGAGYGAAALARWIAERRGRAPASRKKLKVEGIVVEPEESAATEPDAWIRAAQAHLAAGELRKAYRAVFIAVLVRMDHLGAIRFERQRTNGEYLRALRSRPNLLGLLRPAARDFDARWYGGVLVSEADYQRVLETYEAVKAQA